MILSIVYFKDFEEISASTSVGTLTTNKINSLEGPYPMAFITIEGGSIRFRLDGNDPTADSGHLLNDGDTFEIFGRDNLLNFKFILDSNSTSAKLSVSYGVFGI